MKKLRKRAKVLKTLKSFLKGICPQKSRQLRWRRSFSLTGHQMISSGQSCTSWTQKAGGKILARATFPSNTRVKVCTRCLWFRNKATRSTCSRTKSSSPASASECREKPSSPGVTKSNNETLLSPSKTTLAHFTLGKWFVKYLKLTRIWILKTHKFKRKKTHF